MKKLVIFIMMLLIFLASCGIGYFYLNTRDDQKKESKADENILVENNVKEEYVSTETSEEKISPNTEITKEIFYSKCGHEIIEIQNADTEMVNLTKEEFEKKYKDYQIEEFSSKQINLYTQVAGICPEHYLVGESEGNITSYIK